MATTDREFTKDEAEDLVDTPSVGEAVNVFQDFQALAPGVVKETKAGWKTTEFWLVVAGAIGTVTDTIPAPTGAEGYIVAALLVAYAIARGVSKAGIPNVEKPPE